MDKIAVIGDKSSVLAFKSIGVDVLTPKKERHDIRNSIRKNEDKYGEIFITETYASLIPETIHKYKSKVLPAIILIPDSQGSLGIGMEEIKKNVEKAVGTDIL